MLPLRNNPLSHIPCFLRYLPFFLLLSLISQCKDANNMARQGLEYLNDKKNIAALNLFDQALEIDEGNPLALFGKGKIFIREPLTLNIGKEMLTRSITGLEDKFLKKEAYLLLSEVSSKEESIQILEKAILDQSAVDADLFHALAKSQLKNDQIKKAISTYETGMKKYPKDHTIHKELGVVLASRLKNYREAYTIFKVITKKKPEDIESLYYLSKISYNLRKRKEALSYLDKILQQEVSLSLRSFFEDVQEKIKTYRWKPSLETVEMNL